ncbi:hypothetical protein F5876DRAFT_78650 [Lentinula aff. lateritia]|uniref:Uncharacterized protein n=1 Tax=Lentinula aff. lateritia TaxID=2804960 RepID=A0ACC1TVN2_9AGAR|nr:hypothetical protein F5876DRAFT_78650 [Lentinula aff. lateritia]
MRSFKGSALAAEFGYLPYLCTMTSSVVLSLILALFVYLALVRICRYHRVNKSTARYTGYGIGIDKLELTPGEAQQIVHDSLLYDAPLTMLLGFQITLFKVFVIPTIASTFYKSGHLMRETDLNKRLVDTVTLMATILCNTYPSQANIADEDPRAAIALARVNWIHTRYKIKNEDYLFNLALLILEPIQLTEHFNWRPHSLLEKKAIFTLWTNIGKSMGIKNIWSTFEEMEQWTTSYRKENIMASEEAYKLSQATINHFLNGIPELLGLRFVAYNFFLTLLDEQSRLALQLPPPSPAIAFIIFILFRARAWIVRYLCLPRLSPSLWVPMDTGGTSTTTGIHRLQAVLLRSSGPYYYPEKTGIALKIQSLLIMLGLQDPNKIPGKKWRSEGYRLEELGPTQWENVGHEKVMEAASKIQGHPITGIWSLLAQKKGI